MSIGLTFKNIKPKDRTKWRTALTATLASMPQKEKQVIPAVYLYPNLFMSLVDKFDVTSETIDDIAKQFYVGNAWAYSRLIGANKNDKFISLSIGRFEQLREFVTPEFTIFHEFGHFQISERLKVKAFASNINDIEMKCDRYGLYALVRMLYFNTHYKTISNLKRQIDFEHNVRKLIRQKIRKKNITNHELSIKFSLITDEIMRLMKWDDLYKDLS